MKLVNGSGSETTGACWMSALHYYTRQDRSWSDQAPWACVSPIVRSLCIHLNDRCPDGIREELIGPHLFAPLGTLTTPEDEKARRYLCFDARVRIFAPIRLRAWKQADLAEQLEAIPEIVDERTGTEAQRVTAVIRQEALKRRKAAAAAAYARKQVLMALRDLILRCCAVGERQDVAESCSRERVHKMLECGSVAALEKVSGAP